MMPSGGLRSVEMTRLARPKRGGPATCTNFYASGLWAHLSRYIAPMK